MIEHAIVGALIGAALALRFNVIVLFPAMGAVAALVFVSEMAAGAGGWTIVLTTIVTAAFLQLGFIGIIIAEVTPANTSPEIQTESRRRRRAVTG